MKFLHFTKGINKSTQIMEEINESNNICVNMQPPEDLKGRPIVGGPNSPTQGRSDLLEKMLTPTYFIFENIYEG